MNRLLLLLSILIFSALFSTSTSQNLSSIISEEMFNEMLKHRNNIICPARDFYSYNIFIAAAKSFKGFGTTGDLETRKREIVTFFAQTSHETTAGWPDAPHGPYAWGYCFKEVAHPVSSFCVPHIEWPCVPGKKYYRRGPIMLTYNYNYGPAGQAIGVDLLSNPEWVSIDPFVSFKTAIWFWMTPSAQKPSLHDAITGQWKPSTADIAANRLPGYGVTINILNGELECDHGEDERVKDRIGFYKRYCDLFGISYGDNIDCYDQKSFEYGLAADSV